MSSLVGSDALKKEIERLKKENEKLKEASIFVEMLKQVTENDEKAALIEALKDESRELINIGTQRLRIIETLEEQEEYQKNVDRHKKKLQKAREKDDTKMIEKYEKKVKTNKKKLKTIGKKLKEKISEVKSEVVSPKKKGFKTPKKSKNRMKAQASTPDQPSDKVLRRVKIFLQEIQKMDGPTKTTWTAFQHRKKKSGRGYTIDEQKADYPKSIEKHLFGGKGGGKDWQKWFMRLREVSVDDPNKWVNNTDIRKLIKAMEKNEDLI